MITSTGGLLGFGSARAASAPAGRGSSSAWPRGQLSVGMLQATSAYYPAERASGFTSVTIGASWAAAEPSPGQFSTGYLASLVGRIARARAAGFKVILDTGTQYAPSWVFALPGGTYFVDQYGDAFTGPSGSGNRVANAVTDMAVRSALASYLAALAHAIPAGLLSAVRAGGGPYGELRYPSSSYAGHTDCWWAYDQSTQATSPVPGWRPGTGSVAQATAFLNSYNANLTQFAAWQDSTYSSDFRVPVLLLMPGWGQRPGVAAEVESSLLIKSYAELN